MGNLDGFDATTVDPDVGFEPVPEADYTVIATESEFKETKDPTNDNEYLQFSFEIIEGEYKGRVLFDRINLKNSNETALKIAKSTLSAICHAVGVMKPKDSSELHGRPMIASVILEPYKEGYSNKIKKYSAVNGASVKSTPKGDGEGDSVPPWKR